MDKYKENQIPRAKEIFEFRENSSVQDTMDKFGIAYETVGRYCRLYKEHLRLNKVEFKESKKGARILLLDVETAPMIVYAWGLWKQNIDYCTQVKESWYIINWAAKWIGEEEVMSGLLTPSEITTVSNNRDNRIMKELWYLMEEADIIIAHNGVKFDAKKINTRFIVNRINPPTKYKVVDTLLQAKKTLGFSSNRLDAINMDLQLERKKKHEGMNLWIRCMNGEQEALDEMSEYCKQDVIALEDTYLALLPFMSSHPNVNVFDDIEEERCSSCGSINIHLTDSKYATGVSRFPIYRCSDCGSQTRGRDTELSKNKRKTLLTSMV